MIKLNKIYQPNKTMQLFTSPMIFYRATKNNGNYETDLTIEYLFDRKTLKITFLEQLNNSEMYLCYVEGHYKELRIFLKTLLTRDTIYFCFELAEENIKETEDHAGMEYCAYNNRWVWC